jgi:uncharacterized protein (DUF2062 family)
LGFEHDEQSTITMTSCKQDGVSRRAVKIAAAISATLADTVHPWLRAAALVWERAKHEHSTPFEISCSVAVGVFSGCTPFLGLHMWIALALATLLRLNRLWAVLGSRISFMPLFAVITFCEVEIAHRLREGAWVPLSPHDAVGRGKQLMADWLIGAAVVGAPLAMTIGLAAYLVARMYQINARLPPAPRPLPSESPPSAPPAPNR